MEKMKVLCGNCMFFCNKKNKCVCITEYDDLAEPKEKKCTLKSNKYYNCKYYSKDFSLLEKIINSIARKYYMFRERKL